MIAGRGNHVPEPSPTIAEPSSPLDQFSPSSAYSVQSLFDNPWLDSSSSTDTVFPSSSRENSSPSDIPDDPYPLPFSLSDLPVVPEPCPATHIPSTDIGSCPVDDILPPREPSYLTADSLDSGSVVDSSSENSVDSHYTEPPEDPIDAFLCSFSDTISRKTAAEKLNGTWKKLPAYSPKPRSAVQLVALWKSREYARNPFLPSGILDDPPAASANVYKRVANKVRPVATTLPEDFRIIRMDHPNPLAGMPPLPPCPPAFVPTGRFTQERREKMAIGKSFLWPEEIKLAEWIVAHHNQAFAWTDDERGSFGPPYFQPINIPIISHIPWIHRQGPIPRGILQEVTKIIQEKWHSGVYEPSSSSYNSRWFCVFKKDGKSLRIVHSLEPLNAVTIKNAAMPPYIDVVAEDFAGCGIFTTLDLYVAFDQRQIDVKSRDMTTFNTPLGAFRLTAIPMGWTNSPAVLQGDVSHIFREETPEHTHPWADDIPVKGPKTRYERPDGSYETIPENPGIRRFVWEHFIAVHRIIQRGKAYGVTFSGKKTFIGVPETDILGHIVNYEGRIADPTRVQAIQDWPVPTNVSEVRAFLGTCGVLRIFIKDYTIIARPLIKLTRKDVPFEIGPEQLDSIQELKTAIASSPALRPLDYESERPVVLAVDSCANGVGYILFQLGEGKKRYPSRFGSITFNDREARYSQAKLELYGLFRALKETRLFTIGIKKFIVEMDAKFIKGMINNPTLHPNDAVNRWISAILLFDFDLVHIPADKHTGADGLSRRPRADEDPSPEDSDILQDWIDSNAGFFIDASSPASDFDPAPSLCMALVPAAGYNVSDASRNIPPDPGRDGDIPRSAKALKREAKLKVIRHFLETLARPPNLSDDDFRQFIRQAMDYYLFGDRFFRKHRDGHLQLIPEPPQRLTLMEYAHDKLGHKGVFATSRNLLLRFWWPHLNESVRWFIRTCHECQIRQTEYFHIPPVVPEVPSLFRKAHMDTFFMPKSGNYRYVHHARDAMTSYPEGRGATSDSHTVIATFIFQDILCRWGAMEEIVTDNGTPWIKAVDLLAKRYGIHHIRISGYNSRANGIVESKHFDVREAIIKTCEGNEAKWRQVLPQVFWAERVTIRKATGYSPYYMVHGVHPLLPFDFLEANHLLPPPSDTMSTEELVSLRARQLAKRPKDLKEMRNKVTEFRVKNLERFERDHSSRIIDFDFKAGDLVLIRNTRVKEALNRKTKPRYLGPMRVVRKTIGTSYIVSELDGARSQLRIAGFRVVPYFARSQSSVSVTTDTLDDKEEEDDTFDDPEDVDFFESLSEEERVYESLPIPSL
jgi:hypothetical protein